MIKNKTKSQKALGRRKFVKKALLATGATALGASGLAAPAVTAERIEVIMVMTWPKNLPGLGTGAARFAKRVSELSEGRINITLFAAGERVGAFDVFDHVAKGDAQMYHGAEYYFTGKEKSFGYFTAVPFGLTYTEFNAWIRFAGGQELWDELSDGFGLKGFMCGNTGVQMGGWFRKEMKSPADFKGLKMRIPGLGGQVMTKLGTSVIAVPGGQIYEQLMAGTIDATEWVGPWNDEFLKFYEAAKYYYYPGMHEPGSMLGLVCNKSWLSKLSKTDQALIEAACTVENEVMMSEFNANNGFALQRLVKDHGVKVVEFNDRIYDAFGKASEEVFAETAASSAIAKKVTESFLKARTELGAWNKLSDSAYVTKRNKVLGL